MSGDNMADFYIPPQMKKRNNFILWKLETDGKGKQISDVQKIIADKSLGKGFCIGHSYFCNQTVCTDEWLDIIVNYEILPMLSEYWFDEPATLQRWESNLRGALQ